MLTHNLGNKSVSCPVLKMWNDFFLDSIPKSHQLKQLNFYANPCDELSSGTISSFQAQCAIVRFESGFFFFLDILTPIERWAEIRMYLFRAGR
jgi:hypothetical protein